MLLVLNCELFDLLGMLMIADHIGADKHSVYYVPYTSAVVLLVIERVRKKKTIQSPTCNMFCS